MFQFYPWYWQKGQPALEAAARAERARARGRAPTHVQKLLPSCTIGCRLRAPFEHSDMGKVKAKLRSKAKQSVNWQAEASERAAKLRSWGLQTFDEFAFEAPAHELGVMMVKNFGLVDWEVDFMATRFLAGTGKALLPVSAQKNGGIPEYYQARDGVWKNSEKALDRLCEPIPRNYMASATDHTGILKSFHNAQTHCLTDSLHPAHTIEETWSALALDLLHRAPNISMCAGMKTVINQTKACKLEYMPINSECFDTVRAAQRVRDLFVAKVQSGDVRIALEAGDVVVTPHFSRFNVATHANEFCKIPLKELVYEKDMPHEDIATVALFLQCVGEFWGPFYNRDEDIKPPPFHWLNRLVERCADPREYLDAIPYENNARRTIMAAVATPGKLKWNVGPAGSVFANVSIWAGPNYVCTDARLTLCPIKFPPCRTDGNFGRLYDPLLGDLPEKCRNLMKPEEYSAYTDFWTKECDWVYERPRLRIAFEFTRNSFEFGNAKEWTAKTPKVRHPGGGCHATPPPPPPNPEPVEPDNSEWLKVLYKGVAREMCDDIFDAVLRRVRAPPRRSAAERRAEAAEVHVRAPGAAHHHPRVVVRAAAVAEGSVEDSKKKAAREAHLAKLAEQRRAKKEARKRADDARYEQMRNELVGAAIGGW